jgi:DNA-binding NtrC family response regulator
MGRLRILVADDDADSAHALAELLLLEGHAAVAATGGQEALRLLEADEYQMALLDVSLPGRNDVESFRELRARQAKMRSYLVTAHSLGQLLQQTVKSGSIQMLGGRIAQDEAAAAVRRAGADGIIVLASGGPDAARGLQELLADSEYVVAHATEAWDARAQIEERRVHVLILDASLRTIDAAGVYATLAAEGHARPTIIATGVHRTGPGDAPATGIITKPYDPKLLLEQIDRLAA